MSRSIWKSGAFKKADKAPIPLMRPHTRDEALNDEGHPSHVEEIEPENYPHGLRAMREAVEEIKKNMVASNVEEIKKIVNTETARLMREGYPFKVAREKARGVLDKSKVLDKADGFYAFFESNLRSAEEAIREGDAETAAAAAWHLGRRVMEFFLSQIGEDAHTNLRRILYFEEKNETTKKAAEERRRDLFDEFKIEYDGNASQALRNMAEDHFTDDEREGYDDPANTDADRRKVITRVVKRLRKALASCQPFIDLTSKKKKSRK